MRTLFAALRRKLSRPRPSSEGSLIVHGPCNDPGAWTFTVEDGPQEGRPVESLTVSCERIDDPEWLEMICRLCNIRFAAAEDTERRHPDEGGADDASRHP